LNRGDCIDVLDRALASLHGIRLDFEDERTARRARQRLYAARAAARIAACSEPAISPVVAFTPKGKLAGVLKVLNPRRKEGFDARYDLLRLRVSGRTLYVLSLLTPLRIERYDELELPPTREVDFSELAELSVWPPFTRGR
jgi:hypothetical protein